MGGVPQARLALSATLEGKDRWPPGLAVLVVALLQVLLSDRLVPGPVWLLPTLELLLAVGLVVAAGQRVDLEERTLRAVSLGLLTVVAGINTASLVLLVNRLLSHGTADGRQLLAGAAAVWLTNVVVFGLAYWELDRGGPLARGSTPRYRDLQFPQDADPALAPAHWRPFFVDFLFVALTAATAFSPTDVMPLTHRAKLLVGAQSLISLLTVGLVAARAVNVLQ